MQRLYVFATIVVLLIALAWMTRVRDAAAVEMFTDLGDMPSPRDLFKNARALLDKYDTPDVWNHASQVMNKDPGQLARMHLNINNGDK